MTTNAKTDPVVVMDSRKFLGALNDSAQAKVAEFDGHIHEMGRKAGKNWRLTALKANDIYFEDVDANTYYVAEHKTSGGKVTIQNIRPIQIQEGEKQKVFGEACCKLIDAIEENDQAGMQSAFNRMRSHKFSGRSVPYSGYVRCKDNITRQIQIASSDSLSEDVRGRLIAAIVEGLRDQVLVENGQVVSASFSNGDPVKLPVTKWAARKLVAKKMRSAAENAYWSEGFQKRIKHIAQLVSEGNIEGAVKFVSPFLDDMEEFTLLSRPAVQSLVENSLAANAIFNQSLCNDVATLFHRTNLRVNRRKVIDEWRNIARKAEHAVLAENVQILEDAKNFEAAYDKFLELIFEAISNKEVAAEALATTLEVLRNKTPRIKESHDLSSKLENLITRLKDPAFDDAAIYEAEDLIATIQEELAATETLSNFDQMPGGGDDLGLDELAGGEEAGGGAPVININSPLIQVGGSSSAGDAAGGGAEEDLGGLEDLGAEEEMPAEEPMPGEEMGGGGEEGDLAALLGGGGGGGGLGLESKQRRRRPVSESNPTHYEMKKDGDDDHGSAPEGEGEDELEESRDPYAIREGEFKAASTSSLNAYGAPVLTDEKQLRQIVGIMNRLRVEHNLSGQALVENLESMAEASINAIGLRIPKGRLPKALEEAVDLFNEMVGTSTAGIADMTGGGAADDDDDGDDLGLGDDDDMAEDQFKGPRIRGRGFKKTAYKPRELKNESIQWGQAQEDAMAGSIGGVNFIFDHGGADESLKPIIMSEDGSVEIPIPEELYDDAFAAANMADGEPANFVQWLGESLEQLRPISSEEDAAIEEAMAKITTTPEGGISVEVSDDVQVGEAGMDDGMEMGGEEEMDTAGMEPVDAVDPEMGDEMGDEMGGEMAEPMDDGSMPDYEEGDALEPGGEPQGGDVADAAPGGEMAPQGGEMEEEPQFEDKDVTEPSSSKYTKHVKDNKRDMPEHKPTKATDDNLDSLGPSLKQDDGSGTKPPTAKSMSQK